MKQEKIRSNKIKKQKGMKYEVFQFLSESLKFQKVLRKLGYKTKRKTFAGISSPYTIIYYKKNIKQLKNKTL